jgi:hypothetical protein
VTDFEANACGGEETGRIVRWPLGCCFFAWVIQCISPQFLGEVQPCILCHSELARLEDT